MLVEVQLGDITTQAVEAIVNAANSGLLGGGGVDGAIHRAAGAELLHACQELRRTRLPGGLAVGQAIATPGFDLPAKWVIHTVGPNRHAGQTDPALLRAAFLNSLWCAAELGCHSVALPAVSAGVYGWDADAVAHQAMAAVQEIAQAVGAEGASLELVRFVLFNQVLLTAFAEAQRQLLPVSRFKPN
ncbi:O-acetyl-ADP-ribose deacetylase [Actinomyces bovis]|nr:O-acetyl-ADP-ribose deacetylase [Actinomyces bovis]